MWSESALQFSTVLYCCSSCDFHLAISATWIISNSLRSLKPSRKILTFDIPKSICCSVPVNKASTKVVSANPIGVENVGLRNGTYCAKSHPSKRRPIRKSPIISVLCLRSPQRNTATVSSRNPRLAKRCHINWQWHWKHYSWKGFT